MLTYELKKEPGLPLYESLYRCIREDILAGHLEPGQKLPSKRSLSVNLKVSKITVEGAYNQLLAEGYIRSEEKRGYFVETVERTQSPQRHPSELSTADASADGPVRFPFSVWSRLQRQVTLDMGQTLLLSLPNQGVPELRRAIARHLWDFRGMEVDQENILVGAGTDFLYNLLIQLLGRELLYAVEEPGYSKIRQIYGAAGARCVSVQMDAQGVLPGALHGAQVLHISPSHHFPTGIVTPLPRRMELLGWAREAEDRWIIEDDYDCEFRFAAHPMPALQSLDSGKVIYLNTFSKTLAPSIRISYMVLPRVLMERFRRELGCYSCTVSSFEQYTLARFLEQGHFEKHLNRMRKFYKARRNRVLDAIAASPVAGEVAILEENAGLHFLLRGTGSVPQEALMDWLQAAGIRAEPLRRYYHGPAPDWAQRCLVVNYSGLTEESARRLQENLAKKPGKAEEKG